jgi:MerR family transcriptional regulator, light-induced transcriptional regulator
VSTYSIKDLERISGIKAHTIRIWEQRYNIISPNRTDTNIRNYDDEDLKSLLNIGILNNSGYKISKIAKMHKDEITASVLEITANNFDANVQIDNLIIAMAEMDEDRFEKFLSSNILRSGFERTFLEILHPFMVKVGVLWITNSINPAQEHFISNLVRQKLIASIDGIANSSNPEVEKCLLYLPENELHEINLLFANLVLKKQGLKTIYLGQSVPYTDIKMVCDLHQPTYLITVITCSFSDMSVESYIEQLSNDFPQQKILVSGYQFSNADIKLPSKVKLFNSPKELLSYVS